MVGDLAGYGTVWYHKNGIANILSLAKVSREHNVKIDSANGNKFEVKKKNGTWKTMTFKQSSNGLYFFDINKNNRGITMVTTVEKRMEKYTRKTIEQAKLARKIQQAIGYPSTTEFIKIIERGDIKDCPVNKADIHVAEDIFGPDIGSLKGKTVRRNTGHVEDAGPYTLPPDVINNYKQMTICAE